MSDSRADQPGRAERLAEALRVPVLIAAAASVPAVFLSPLDGPLGAVGTLVNWMSMLVLTGESALLLFRSPDRLGWLRRNWWVALVAVATVPAVFFAVGPVQVLRLVRVVAALQVLKVRRLVKSARIIFRRGVRFARLRALLSAVTGLLALVLVGLVMLDPESTVRQVFGAALRTWGWGPILGAGVLAGSALGLARAARRRRASSSSAG